MALNNSRTFARRLLAWYDKDHRDLPWRGQTDPYRIWISEAMLQQTVVATVIPYFNRFLQTFPSLQSLADASDEDVMRAWAGLGYYSRARSLKRAAEMVAQRPDGRLPDSEAGLRELPGVGPYTAAAVAAIAFGRVAFALDGNAARVMARVSGEEGYVGDNATKQALWRYGLDRVPPDRPGDFAQAVMELGARVCVPRKPKCNACPVAAICVARRTNQVALLPAKRPKPAKRPVHLVCLAAHRNGELLLERRPPPGLLTGTWTLLRTEPQAGQGVEEAVKTFVFEAGLEASKSRILPGRVRHLFTHLDVQATVVLVQVRSKLEKTNYRWMDRASTASVPLASFTQKLLAHLGASWPQRDSV